LKKSESLSFLTSKQFVVFLMDGQNWYMIFYRKQSYFDFFSEKKLDKIKGRLLRQPFSV